MLYTDPTMAKIQGLSVQAGELLAQYWNEDCNSEKFEFALEAYKNLRRLLPLEDETPCMTQRHIGATAAHAASQGWQK